MKHRESSLRPTKLILASVIALAACTLLTLWASATNGPSQPAAVLVEPSRPGGVSGSIWIEHDKEVPGTELVALRDFEVYLVVKGTADVVATATSDVYGRYYFPKQPVGTYTLGWNGQNGWRNGQYADDIEIIRGHVNPDGLFISPDEGFVAIVGKVRLLDGGVPAIVDEYFGLIETPTVTLVNGSSVELAGPVRANNVAAFALAVRLTDLVDGQLRAAIGTISQSDPVGSPIDNVISQNLTLMNRGLEIAAVHVTNGLGVGVTAGVGGEVLQARAEVVDGDGDPVQVRWRTAFGTTSSSVVVNGNLAAWTLPGGVGGHVIYALVHDGKGGFARGRAKVNVGKTTEFFDGTVVDKETGVALENAEIEVNGRTTTSLANGYWLVVVPVAQRYVLNIRHLGYALAGNTFEGGSNGRIWRLIRCQAATFDPAFGVQLVDKRELLGQQKRRGATIQIEPNTLVGPDGRIPRGTLTAFFATLDIGADEAPGDWAARGGEIDVGLVSYGVVSIDIVDGSGNKYQLANGASARVSIPISGVSAGGPIPNGAPQQIPIWSYDEVDGYWKESGTATLDVATATYVGLVNHFSTVNMDQPGSATCVRVLSDPGLLGRYFRVSDVAGDGIDYSTVKENELDKPINAIYRVPPNQKIQVDVLIVAGGGILADVVIERFDSANPQQGWVTLSDHEVQTGPAVVNLWPSYPYDECPITITLKWKEPILPFFLHNKGIGSDALALDYYDQVNPQLLGVGNRDDLALWWSHNGFNTDGSATPGVGEQYARASYLNDNDLGSGRDMHFFQRVDGRVAAWVSNYGGFDQNHSNATLALLQNNNGDLVATVCMEFSPMENAMGQFLDGTGTVFDASGFPTTPDFYAAILDASAVKFFVFADVDGLGSDELLTSADLDGYGDKFVPNLCMNCHGGSPAAAYSIPSDADVTAYFRELDYNTFKFPLGSPTPSVAEQMELRVQNDIVRGVNASLVSSSGTKELIDIWYRDGVLDIVQDDCLLVGGVLVNASIPVGWDNNDLDREFYCDVVGRSCRTCHIAFDNFDFTNSTYFADGSYVEGRLDSFINNTPNTGTMPHAIITYRNFWLSENPFRPDSAQFYIDNN